MPGLHVKKCLFHHSRIRCKASDQGSLKGERDLPPINSIFNMAVVSMMGGGPAREDLRKGDRGQIDAKISPNNTATEDAYLEFIVENGSAAGLALALKAGHYAFVTKLDGSIVVWRVRGEKDTDHSALGSFSPAVLFAGEIFVNEDNKIEEWNNKSGAYHPKAELAEQAKLPISKFVKYK